MSAVFAGGSRSISRLPSEAKERLDNAMKRGLALLVGDANGADKAIQRHMTDAGYSGVEVFCSGEAPRNNLGGWPVRSIAAPKGAKGFQFYAAKDRAMAREAEFGLMVWDSRSAGTLLNVLRLLRAGKKAVLIDAAAGTMTFKTAEDWNKFISGCGADLVKDLKARATTEEWGGSVQQPALFE